MQRLRLLALIVGFVLHVLAAFALWRGLVGWALLAHVAGSAAWGVGATRFHTRAPDTPWWLPAAWALLFPVAGLLASLAFSAILRQKPVDRSDRRYVIWNESSHGDGPTALPAGGAQSIVEILQSPRTQLRRNAVLALRELDPQMAIPLLRKGLQDSDEQVRIYAQNILSSMLERFEEGIKQLEQRLRAEPSEAVTATRLAEQYYELVYLDVAGDDETAAHYLAKALTLLETAATTAPGDGAIAFLGFKYALRARDAQAARRWLTRVEATHVDPQQLLPWQMELAFLESDWPRLRKHFATFQRAGYVNPRIEELSRFWFAKEAAA